MGQSMSQTALVQYMEVLTAISEKRAIHIASWVPHLFKNSREMIEAKKKYLEAGGLGNRPNKAIALTEEELETLWTNGGYGDETPEQITASVWFLLSLQFGFRGAHESQQLLMGDIVIKRDENGDKYLECVERLTKTRIGIGNNQLAFNPKAWATGGPRCPVRIYQAYNAGKPYRCSQLGNHSIQQLITCVKIIQRSGLVQPLSGTTACPP